jgi:phenylacetate-coenzyme A ligase PaaK-like adenylate-forming protein
VDAIDKLDDVLAVCFDHRVLKNYPISIIENRDFPKLTAWLDKLTAHDLSRLDLTGITTIEQWLVRLEEFGMLITYSSGTTGKLSFVPRSRDEVAPGGRAILTSTAPLAGWTRALLKCQHFIPAIAAATRRC